MSSKPSVTKQHHPGETVGYKDALFGVAALLLGLLVAVVGFFALMMWLDARHARDDAQYAAAKAAGFAVPLRDLRLVNKSQNIG